MIRLFQFPPAFGLPNASGFCLKLETWLRMAGLPYQNVYTLNLARAPKGKLPHIDDDGTPVADSALIIDHLTRRYGVTLDDRLTNGQRALALMARRTLEEHLYWCVVYFRWVDERYWPATREALFGGLGVPACWIVPPLARRGMIGQVRSAGIGRHAPDDITAMARDDLAAIDAVLGDKPFMLGEPSSLDASAYGLLANIILVDVDLPIRRAALEFPRLVAYCERMRQVYW